MNDHTVRLYTKRNGIFEDMSEDIGVSQLAGVVPNVGDYIVGDAVMNGGDARNPSNRTIYKVVARFFRSRGHDDYVAVVVEGRVADESHANLL